MVAFARAYVQLEPDMRTFPGKAREGVARAGLDKEGEKHGRSFGARFGGAAKLALAGLGTLVAVKGFELFSDIIKEGAEAARTSRIVAAAIKSTGGAANVSTEQISKLTEAIGNQAGVDDDVVKAGSAMLLTFRNIRNEQGKGNDIFNQANKTLVDMTAALHGGNVTGDALRKQAIQLGKALNDPVKGLTALQRVGVTFTEGQKKQITSLVESGHRLEAQKIILRELGKEFGGAAAASASPMQKLKARFDNFKESLGTALLPVLNTFVVMLNQFLMPALAQFGDWFAKSGAPAISTFAKSILPSAISAFKIFATIIAQIVNVIGAMPSGFRTAALVVLGLSVAYVKLTPVVKALSWIFISTNRQMLIAKTQMIILRIQTIAYRVAQIAVAAATKAWAAAQWLLNAALDANPIGLVVIALVALGAALYLAWTKSATFRKILIDAWNAIYAVALTVINWFRGPFVSFFTDTIPNVFGAVLKWVRGNWPWLLGALTGPIGLAVVWIVKHWSQMINGIKTVWANVIGFIRQIPGWVLGALRSFGTLLIGRGQQLITGLWNGIKTVWGTISDWLGGMPGRVGGFFRGALNWLLQAGKNVIWGLYNGMLAIWHKVTSFVSSIAGWIKSHKGPIALDQKLLEPAGRALMSGLHTGLIMGSSGPFGFISGIAGTIGAMLAKGIHGVIQSIAVPNVGGGVARWAGVVRQALAMEGLPLSLARQVLYQISTESGGNPNAINLWDSNAAAGDPSRGLLQTIGGTFAAYHWPGTSWNIYDPLANIAAAINYARHRYGPSLMSGGMGLGSGHGYAAGGPITEPIIGYGRSGRRYTFGEAGEETVIPGRYSNAGVERRLEVLIDAVERNSALTGAAVADVLNGVSRSAAYAARYSVG